MSLGRVGCLSLILALSWGCSSAPVRRPGGPSVSASKVVKTVKAQIGKPYRYGGKSPSEGFDCSGLVFYSYQVHGAKLPRTAREQFQLGRPVDRDDLEAGDLVFFKFGGQPLAHVGTMVGERAFVHAPSTGGRVRQDYLNNPYWAKRFHGARRLQ